MESRVVSVCVCVCVCRLPLTVCGDVSGATGPLWVYTVFLHSQLAEAQNIHIFIPSLLTSRRNLTCTDFFAFPGSCGESNPPPQKQTKNNKNSVTVSIVNYINRKSQKKTHTQQTRPKKIQTTPHLKKEKIYIKQPFSFLSRNKSCFQNFS